MNNYKAIKNKSFVTKLSTQSVIQRNH